MSIAFVDESAHGGSGGLYVIAAAVVVDASADEIRAALRRLLLRGQVRFHWRDESTPRRRRMLEMIASLGLECRAYVRAPVAKRHQDRARRLCLEALVWDLRDRGIDELVIETRGLVPDRRDSLAIRDARRAKVASPALRYRFGRPKDEPLLWIPDAIAGAISALEADPAFALAAELEVLAVKRVRVRE